ncbi:hypothetical protein FV222_01925 [Methylobacterium sp. WL103]|nr:hypothetical protein FV222_01925 [Methylobacterium sp. WL103]
MKKFATLTAAALVAVSAMGTTAAEARGGGAIAAGVIGGLAAGALLGAAVAEAHEAPAYGYGYGRPAPAYGYDYGASPVVPYRPARVVREYDHEEAPVYRAPPPARFYGGRPEGYGYHNAGYSFRHAGYGYQRDCDRPHGYGGW